MKPSPRAGERRFSAAERIWWALIAGVLILWAFLDGGLR
jgi:hypothetical protein